MKIGDLIYHKYLGKITVKDIRNEGIVFHELNNKVFLHSDIIKNICSKEEYLHNVYDSYEFEKAYKYREIKYICHLTTIYNLINILKKGFFPRTFLSKKTYTNNFFNDFFNLVRKNYENSGLESEFSDPLRLDGRRDCIYFTISKINEKLYCTYRERNDYEYVVLYLSSALLKDFYGDANYYYYNAASNTFVDKRKDRSSLQYFNKMFYRKLNVVSNNEKRTVHRSDDISLSYTTDEQAEILINKIISPKYIKAIYFRNEEEKLKFLENVDYNLVKGINIMNSN